MRYKRVLLKLSGEAMSGNGDFGFDADALDHIGAEVLKLTRLGIEVSLVVGGGNIFRGTLSDHWGIERAEADNIGMLGTIINSLLLRAVISSKSAGQTEVRVMTAIPINAVAEPFIRLRAIHHLDKGYVVIFAGGTGNPYVTTDYPAAQRAIETRSDALLFAKNGVKGVFTSDPNLDPQARMYRCMNYNTILQKELAVVDLSAVILARDHHIPIHMFDFVESDTMSRICQGEDIGTLVTDVTSDELEPA
jgi:uridylate kinase